MNNTILTLKSFKRVYAVFSSIWLLFQWPGSVIAQIDTLNAQNLKDIEFIQYKNYKNFISPASVQSLNGEELKRLNALNVADAVRFFSGVQLKDYGGVGGLKTINVRSMGSNHSAVFFDGIQLGNAQNGQVDLGKFSLENVEEIALYSGQKEDLLQPAKAFASASSLYIKSSSPSFNVKKYNVKVGVKTGSFGLFNPSVTLQNKISNNLSSSFDAEFLNSNGKYKYRYTNGHYDTTVVRTNAEINSIRVEAALHGQTNSLAKWNVKLYKYQSERGIPGAIVSNKFDFTQRQWDDNVFIQANYQNDVNKKFIYLINTKYANDYLRHLDPDRKSDKGPLDNQYKQQEWYFSTSNVFHVNNNLDFSFSTDYTRQILDANLYRFSYPTRQTALLVLAGKYVTPKFNLQANVLATYVDDKVKMNTGGGQKQKYTPTVMFSVQPFESENFRIKGFYKSIFRMPTFNDLYYTFVGNTLLDPETANQFDLGFNFKKNYQSSLLKYLSIQSDLYYNQVKNKIVAVPTANLFRWTMMNLDEVEIKGLEFNIKMGWLIGLIHVNTSLNYTFESAKDVTKTGYTFNHQIPYIPKHSGSFTSSLQYKSLGLNYSYIYTGERYSQKANIPVNYIKPFYTHDLALHKTWGKQEHLKLAVEVNNVFNQYYDVVLNYPMPGRNFRINLKAKI